MNEERDNSGQSGGVNFSGSGTVTVHGNVAGRDMTIGAQISSHIEQIFQAVAESIRANSGTNETAALQKLDELKTEAAKGRDAKDNVMAKMIEGLVGLVPSAVSAIVSAFATPLLGGIAGPATKYVLDKIQGK